MGCAVEIFYRSLFPRSRKPRRARKLLIIAALAALPALAAGVSQAVGTPSILTSSTMDDGNGFIDQVRVTFSTTMDTSLTPRISTGAGAPGIRVEGYQIDTSRGARAGFDWSGSQTLDIYLVEGATPDTGATPTLHYVQGGDVQSAPPAPGELEVTERATADGAGPVLLRVRAKDTTPANLFRNVGDELLLDFSEPTKLAGATKTERWSNLERAIKFDGVVGVSSEPNTCPKDGDGGITDYNFPQPKAGNAAGADPIVAPGPNEAVATFRIRFSTVNDQIASTQPFSGVPSGCWVGVDAGVQGISPNRAVLVDLASPPNMARGMDVPSAAPQKVRINPLDAQLVTALTRDGTDGSPDGSIEAIELTFDQALDPETIEQPITIGLNGQLASIIGREIFGQFGNQLRLSFTQVPSWRTDAAPLITYTMPSDCTATGGQGMKAIVPAGGSWRTCVGSLDGVAPLDSAGPVALASQTKDADLDGRIDTIQVTFSEPISGNLANQAWTVDGAAITALTVQAEPNAHKADISFAEAVDPDGGRRPSLEYVRQAQANQLNPAGTHDAANNQVVAFSHTVGLDGVAPRITAASEYDVNGDGNIDRAVLTYSEPLVDPANAAGFTIGGRPATLVAPSGDDAANDVTLTLAVSGLTGTDTKEIAFTPGATIRDAAGNASGTQTVIATDVTDEAAPRATISVSPSAPIPAGESTIVVTFTEPMDTDVAPTVTFTTEQGAKTVEPVGFDPDGRAWEGTIEVVELDCTVSAGCPVTASASGGADPAGNALGAPASLTTEIDTVAPAAPVIGSFTATLPAGETAPADTLNMFASDFSVSASIVPGEASPGIATVLLDGTPLDGAVDSAIATGDTSISASSSFGSAAALQAALTEEPHSLTIELCDDAGNCTETATGLDVVVDYTPAVDISLTAPTGGNVIAGGSSSDIVWDGADGDGFDHVTLSYSTNGGQTFPNVIADGLTDRDGTHTWSVPPIDSQNVVVRAALADTEGNKSFGLSDPFGVRSNSVFSDVPSGYWARHHIEAIFDAGITGGCGGGKYCPTNSVTRGQMAVFLVKAMGEDADLGPYQGTFSDVPASNGFALYIERLAELGITSGCGGGKYCPGAPVTRGQMAVFLVRALDEDGNLGSYQGLFTDVPSTNSFALYIEKLADLQITGGCGGGKYCPGASVTRAQMAVFMQKAWDLPMLG